jgi:transposase-like protein
MAEMRQQTNRSARLDWWRSQIQRQPKTGHSIAEFCRQLGVSVATFYYWKRCIHEEGQFGLGPIAAQSPVPNPQTAVTAPAANFVPVTLLDPGAATQLEIELANACVVRLRGAIDPQLLAAVIRAAGPLDRCRQGAD